MMQKANTFTRTALSALVLSLGAVSAPAVSQAQQAAPAGAPPLGWFKTCSKLPLKKLGAGEFLFFSWRDADGKLLGENDFFPKAYKAYDPAQAKVTAKWDGDVLVLSADKPAFFVTATVDVPGYFSDNAITLIPGRETRLTFTPRLGAKVPQKALAKGLKLRHLRETY